MITFGKVFCTKNKPNCNACPMRAECRHFASAFASARLALPGPEEKSIVGVSVPIAADRNPYVDMKPMILPIPENNFIGEATHESGKCEPIIEEPTTPEQDSTNALESDIEDFFVEDPDEIPPIEFNISESATNVQSFMQYMEDNDGDMSKALVALTSQSASIPVQKIKNVSRLRTEHQVYELPDSHPLLEKVGYSFLCTK
ncbi:putative DNA glycosylase, helix-turn-helix, base-excision DNA repair [Lupinus albus]|uniref:Putative DNA glycosylase, helix-turn-helix, base-excision DNA repair n=1 Tax=Lupinus albus TaxID=3870 RepID=A0A6A4QZT0_LUPAL|nr:putative DNA glycosylase, helix-turn-helix, base-excision DNA repair [Lupinus albus]